MGERRRGIRLTPSASHVGVHLALEARPLFGREGALELEHRALVLAGNRAKS